MNRIKSIVILFLLLVPSVLVISINYQQAKFFVDTEWGSKLTEGDQFGTYVSIKKALSGEISEQLERGWIPVGYLALVGFYHKLSNLWQEPNLEATFVYNNLFFTALAAFLSIWLMYRVALDQSPRSNRLLVCIGCNLVWLSMFYLSGILRFSFIPWTHHTAAFVGLSLITCLYYLFKTSKKRWYTGVSFFCFIFLYTRRHEALAVFLALFLVLSLVYFQQNKNWSLKNTQLINKLFFIFFGLLIGAGFVHYFSNGMPLNAQYSQLGKINSFLLHMLRMYPELIPIKFVQTFIDPNFLSFGIDYNIHSIYNKKFGMDDFGMPLFFQIPFLFFLLPFSLSAIIIIFVRIRTTPLTTPAILLFLLGFFSFSVLTCGYLSAALWGGAHLKHGLIREFILSTLLLTIGSGPALYIWISESLNIKYLKYAIPAVGIFLFSFCFGQLYLPEKQSLTQIKSYHLSPESKAITECNKESCDSELFFQFANGLLLNPPPSQINVVQFTCNEGVPGQPLTDKDAAITIKGMKIRYNLIPCPSMLKVQIYPIFMGTGQLIPIASFEACTSITTEAQCL